MALNSKSLVGILVTVVISLALFAVLAEYVGEYTEKDATSGAPVQTYMTNTTCLILDLVPFLVIIGILMAVVIVVLPKDGE